MGKKIPKSDGFKRLHVPVILSRRFLPDQLLLLISLTIWSPIDNPAVAAGLGAFST